MTNEKVFAMSFAKVYSMLIAKAERKGRSGTRCLRTPGDGCPYDL